MTCGIDWARDDHAVSVVDRSGHEIQRWTVVHSEDGLRGLGRRLGRVGVAEVTIERPDGPVVEALLGAGLACDLLRMFGLSQRDARRITSRPLPEAPVDPLLARRQSAEAG